MSLYSRNKDEAARAVVQPNVCRKHTTHTDEAFAVCFYPRLFIYFRTFRVLKSIAYLGPFNLKLYMLMVINSVISRWIQFFINQEMKPASSVTEVKFNPETPNLGLFQIYGSAGRYKTLPRPFYRLLGSFHLILLFPAVVIV